jgi:hypothetical protein
MMVSQGNFKGTWTWKINCNKHCWINYILLLKKEKKKKSNVVNSSKKQNVKLNMFSSMYIKWLLISKLLLFIHNRKSCVLFLQSVKFLSNFLIRLNIKTFFSDSVKCNTSKILRLGVFTIDNHLMGSNKWSQGQRSWMTFTLDIGSCYHSETVLDMEEVKSRKIITMSCKEHYTKLRFG